MAWGSIDPSLLQCSQMANISELSLLLTRNKMILQDYCDDLEFSMQYEYIYLCIYPSTVPDP